MKFRSFLSHIFASYLILFLVFSCDKPNQEILDERTLLTNLAHDLQIQIQFDNRLNSDNSVSFESFNDLKCFIEQQVENKFYLAKNSINRHSTFTNSVARILGDPCDNLSGYFRATTPQGFANLNFGISVDNGVVNSVSPYLSGWTLGTGFTQGGYHQNEVTAGSGELDISVSGSREFSLFWSGIGVIFSQRMDYSIRIPCGGGGGGGVHVIIKPH